MEGKRILITGGAGLIGSHIADLVARQNPAEIVILDNFVRGRLQNLDQARGLAKVTVVEGNIRDAQNAHGAAERVDSAYFIGMRNAFSRDAIDHRPGQ